MIQLITAESLARGMDWEEAIPCDECGKDATQVLLAGEPGGAPRGAIAMCQEHVIKTEAMLRSVRKGGPRVGKWGGEA